MLALAAASFALTATAPAAAQYPDQPIRWILPFPAGGAVDIVARMVAAKMSEDLGKPIIIENKAGAGGIIATDAIAKAAPDGYTLLLTTPNHTINAALQPTLPYDTEKDLVPVSIVAEVPEVLVSHPGAPFTNFRGSSTTPRKIPASSTTRPPASARCRTSPSNCCCAGPASRSRTFPIAARRLP